MTGRERPPESNLPKWVRIRLLATAAILSAALAGVAWRAYSLQVEHGAHFKELAERQHLRTLEIPAPRGAIFDSKGTELAVTAQSDSVFANPREVKDSVGTAKQLAQALQADVRTLEGRLATRRYFAWIKRHVTPEQALAVRNLKLPGVSITQEPRRYYPMGSLAGPVLGFSGIDGHGLSGVERKLDHALVGKRAVLAALRDASGRMALSEASLEARSGASVTLTLDRSVQYIAERALARMVDQHKAAAGVAVVLRVGTGEVLALANVPTYDPNNPGNYAARGVKNRAVGDAYEVGSVMKVFTAAAALDAGAVRPETTFDVEGGRFRIGRKTIRDSFRDTILTVAEILKRSSNIGAYKIARILGKHALYKALLSYGFGSKTGIELPGERSGVVHPPSTWGETGLAAVSYGYNLMATPLQVTAAFAAVGSDGVYYSPRIIKTLHDPDGEPLYESKPEGRRIMKARTANQLLPMLESVFDKGRHGGTGASLTLTGFRAAGKSGTAHKVDRQHGGYSPDSYLSSFIGLAPVEKPQIAILVIIDEPTGEAHYGASVAGPAFVEIARESLRYLGTPLAYTQPMPEPRLLKEAPRNEPAPKPASPTPHITRSEGAWTWIPDFRGLGIARSLDLAASEKLRIRVEGSGRAVAQYPAPGYTRGPSDCRIVFAPTAR